MDGSGPHEQTGGAVASFVVASDRVDEFSDAVHGESLELALTQVAEEAPRPD